MADILYSHANGIGWITLNRPAARNALSFEMYDEIARLCRDAPAADGLHALILTGAGGRAFAAGTEMSAFRAFSEPRHATDYESRVEQVFEAIECCTVPTIAAITGACTGGGAAIASACDLRLADTRLKFGFPIARTLGNALSIANLNRVGHLIGFGRLREILFTARLIEAEEARAIGLVADILPEGEVLEAAEALAARLAGHAPITLRVTKEALRRLRIHGPGAEGSDLIVEAYMSRDFQEGIDAFLCKRPPDWQGR